jgi:hypothetical protein
MISFSELVCAVSVMRSAQKQYFKTKDKKDLYHAWNMERAVDQLLESAFAPVQVALLAVKMKSHPLRQQSRHKRTCLRSRIVFFKKESWLF